MDELLDALPWFGLMVGTIVAVWALVKVWAGDFDDRDGPGT